MFVIVTISVLLAAGSLDWSDDATKPILPPCRDAWLAFVERSPRLSVLDVSSASGKPVLLVGGTDQQLTDWPGSLLTELQANEFRQIQYDESEVGCSKHLHKEGAPDWPAISTALSSSPGCAVADAIPGPRFVGIEGLGHSSPDAVVGRVVQALLQVSEAVSESEVE